MDTLINVVVPVFAIVLAGYLSGYLRVLGEDSAFALNRFVYYFALPPLLFAFTARAPIDEIFNWPFIFSFLLGTALTLIIALLIGRYVLRRSDTGELALLSLSSVFANTAYMGIPLFATAFGPNGTLPAIIATLAGNTLLIGGTVATLEAARSNSVNGAQAILHVLRTLIRNPLLVSPVLGIAVSFTDQDIPIPIGNFLDLMAASAGPVALFALGLSLVGRKLLGDATEVSCLVFLKLVLHPAITFLLVTYVFVMEAEWAQAAVILSALPAGALVFVVAQQYDVYVQRASSAIIVSTALSVVTVSVVLLFYQIS
ncbi:AEC family transporter [Rhodobacteraceae bacterium M382]|nr:AEC family transporter [Rhodobacteraceae bacterium M382]